ncbi:chemotaxis signal transduction protein CheV [Vibrio cholerae]|uniref:Chemotaxis protein CheV n=12 Tax=Gammaproteobacteria TaxID=1236 RepID=Q9KRN4_VIBCH|nr:chemotaxis protein CheV [Vibrio cholerae O1 biovar El Tor str. N16961]ABQ21420.1 chemotaxis protein CheV [Vibrio cholerae O395]ACP05855.1 chemotaxis protein CheV [Vibrio cholerae M66-2]ACQ60938.1 chemotaxis protein CheV [Vibrio cholerae MJ-1236]ARB80767.1 chemotaxis protein CheV [Vibrio cholerae]AVH51779.1 chemotaxis protein CheV [Vibrio cholerae O1 biovar El Tor]EAZ73935.1 chemotaxis protein CheV [Vibrio cholerae NCTC 8457]EAZ77489.1 chemotaxis protein CheV [Vibrio cholerae B33]EEN98625
MTIMSNPSSTILTESGTNELEIIEFHLEKVLPDGRTKTCYYGINVAKVREVIRVPETTDYPNAQPHMIGVFSSREILTPLVDLAGWLGVPTSTDISKKYVIVTDFNRMTNGFLIDSISRIHRISWNDVESPSQFLEAGEQDCVVAVVRQDKKLIMILDFEKIISDINPELSMEKYDVTVDRKVDLNQRMVTKRNAKTIMVVDDSAFIRSLIQDTLSSAGYNIIACKDGGEAHEKLMELKQAAKEENVPVSELIDAVVTDVEMPRMDGMHLIKRLRDDDSYSSMPIVMFSSLMSDDNRAKALALGANDTLTKPEIGKMVAMMDKYILNM